MTIRRRFASVPPVMLMSTKRTRSYEAMPARASHYLLGYPLSRADRMAHDRRAEDYMDDRVTSAGIISTYAMEEGYDTAKKSRDRDARLLRDATDAIVYSESFSTPQASVAARRVARGVSMAPRATSLPPRPLYPEQVGFWDTPRSYEPLYGVDTTGTTTTADYYPYPYLSYPRRPLVLYPKPWLTQSADRILMQKAQARARSVPPNLFYQEEQLLKRQPVPVYEAWRRTMRAKSVAPEILPVSRPYYYPYYPYYSHYERRLSPYYRRRLAFTQPSEPVSLWSLPTEGLRAHRVPRRYLTRGEISTGFSSLWGYYDDPFARRRRRDEEEAAEALKLGVRPRVLASPLARATLARAWRYSAHPFALPKMAYLNESRYGFPMLFVPRKGAKQGERKAAIIASKMEVDSFKGRRPRSEYAARKYRAMRRSDQEGVYLKSPYTSGFYASAPPLYGVDPANPPMSDLRRRIRRTLNKSRRN